MAFMTSISKPMISLVFSSTYSKGAQVASVATVICIPPLAVVALEVAAEVVEDPLLHEVSIKLVAKRAIKPSQSNFFMLKPPQKLNEFIWIHHNRLVHLC